MKTIVFNHRPDKYKHFDQFIDVCDELYKIRQDFQVWVPLMDKPSRPYMIVDKFTDKCGYYRMLATCDVGFSPKQAYGGWSVATMDGMMNGVPYIMYDETYYRELYPYADFFTTQKQAVELLDKYLSDDVYCVSTAINALKYVKRHYLYESLIVKLSELINECVRELESVLSVKSIMPANMVNIIKSNGVISKSKLVKELGWGEAIPYTHVKRRVFRDFPIYDLQGSESIYTYGTEQVTL